MSVLKLYHGSPEIVEAPELAKGNPRNDYGPGFYCTPDIEMAREWACKRKSDGFANCYHLNSKGLRTLDLLDGTHTALHWIALLLANRTFSLSGEYATATCDLILDRFLIDLAPYDIVIGYRADDSYFSFAESFVEGSLSLGRLEKALYLGQLGEQTVLVSQASFGNLTFKGADPVSADVYFPKFLARDTAARREYKKSVARGKPTFDDLVAIDLLRMKEGELNDRIRRISR